MTFADILGVATAVIASLGGGGLIVFKLSGYLGKVWADRALENLRQDYTRLNLELTHQLALVTEQVKNSLQMAALEHQVRFSKLHEKRAEVIAEIYERLVDAEKSGARFVVVEGHQIGTDTQKEGRSKIELEMYELSLFIAKRQIYLPQRVCVSLKTLLDTMHNHVIGVGVYGSVVPFTPQQHRESHEVFTAALNAFVREIPAARKILEDEFRELLGVETSKAAAAVSGAWSPPSLTT